MEGIKVNKEIEHYKALLENQRKYLQDTVENMKRNNRSNQDRSSAGELSNYDNHPSEQGTNLYNVEMSNALMTHEKHLIYEIDEAKKRMDKGTYGKCAFCGNEITKERLEAIPYARLCNNCEKQKSINMEYLKKERPVEELVRNAHFGRKYDRWDDEGDKGFEQFNELMSYGSADTLQDYYMNRPGKKGTVDNTDEISNDEYKNQLPE